MKIAWLVLLLLLLGGCTTLDATIRMYDPTSGAITSEMLVDYNYFLQNKGIRFGGIEVNTSSNPAVDALKAANSLIENAAMFAAKGVTK